MFDELNHVLPEIRNYLDAFPINEDELQKKMRVQAREEGMESWIVTPEVGKFLFMLTRISNAGRIYEVGSYLGYSATWFAKALPEGGHIYLTEKNMDHYKRSIDYFSNSTLSDKVVVKNCDALEDLRKTDQSYDIIFFDHDKTVYLDTFLIAKKRVRKGGLIIADNVLWKNRIVQDEWKDNLSTSSILEFNQHIMSDEDVMTAIIPIGDGLSVSYVK